MKRKQLHKLVWLALCAMVIVSMVFFTVAPYLTSAP